MQTDIQYFGSPPMTWYDIVGFGRILTYLNNAGCKRNVILDSWHVIVFHVEETNVSETDESALTERQVFRTKKQLLLEAMYLVLMHIL